MPENRPRNNFAIAKGDKPYYAVMSKSDLNSITPSIGPLNSRFQRYMRRFVLPVTNGENGPSEKYFIKMPKKNVFQKAPEAVQTVLEPFFTEDYDSLVQSEPWITGSVSDANTKIDQAFGKELETNEQWQSWVSGSA